MEQSDEPCVSFHVRGVAGFACCARLIPNGPKSLLQVALSAEGVKIRPRKTSEGHWEFDVPADRRVELRWG